MPAAKRKPRLRGWLARERGRVNERRVLEAFALESRPPWIRRVREALRIEDNSGIDVVVESDIGKLYIQVKSSKAGKRDFLKRTRLLRIGIVLVKDKDGPEKLLAKVVGALSPIRAQYREERRRFSLHQTPSRRQTLQQERAKDP